MKPTATLRFNGGDPVITVESHGYVTLDEAIEHGNEVIRLAVDTIKRRAALIPELRATINHLQPVVSAAVDWQEDPSTAADTALHSALNAYEDRAKERARAQKAKP